MPDLNLKSHHEDTKNTKWHEEKLKNGSYGTAFNEPVHSGMARNQTSEIPMDS